MSLKERVRGRVLGTEERFYIPFSLRRMDREIFDSVARYHSPVLDRTLPRLGRAANHSGVWMAAAGALILLGGRQGRRAATRGLLSLAAASAIANLPAKFAVRRRRPDALLVPELRRLLRMPTSYSFPSGHSASAAAFATGVALEMPPLAVPAGLLATGVGASRVYTGAHYPSDVLVGMALGAGIALATRHFWPVVRLDNTHPPSLRTTGHAEIAPQGRGLTVVMNPDSGPAWRDPRPSLGQALPEATLIEASGDEVPARLKEAAEEAAVLGVAGGDGTVNAAAEAAHERKMPLLVVPSGTLNHFARDLGIASIADAIKAWEGGAVASVDLAAIDGKPFLNTASFGAYTEFVDQRDRLARRTGKWAATAIALARVLRRSQPTEIELDGERRRIWLAFVGNCRYSPAGFAPAVRERLDDGRFDVRLITAERRWSRTRAALAAITGTLERSKVYEEHLLDGFEMRSMNGPFRLARDGETFDGSERVSVEKLRQPLSVLIPPG
jgi:diacylglycerol kinase family enzyme